MLTKVFAFIFILSLVQFPAAAQELLTLDEAVGIALEKNFSIQIARNEEQIAENNVTLGNAGFLPELNGNGNYTYGSSNVLQKNADNVVTRDRSGVVQKNLGAGLALNWTLFDGFAMFTNYKRLEQLREGGELGTVLQVENTVAQVINGYYNIVRQERILDAQRNNLAYSEERLRLAAAKSSIGTASKLSELQAEVYLNADRSAVQRQEIEVFNAKANLNQLLGRDNSADFAVRDSIILSNSLDSAQIRRLALEQNYLLRLAENSTEIARLNAEQLQSLWYPRVGLTSGYTFNQAQNAASPFPFNQNTGWTAGLNASINILDFNSRRQVENANIEIGNARIRAQELRNTLSVQLGQSYRNYLSNRQILSLEEQNLEITQRTAEIALERFRIGSSTSLELREAQNSLVEARSRLVNARFLVKAAETELLRLSGQIIRKQ